MRKKRKAMLEPATASHADGEPIFVEPGATGAGKGEEYLRRPLPPPDVELRGFTEQPSKDEG